MLFRAEGVLEKVKSALKPVAAMELDESIAELQTVPRPTVSPGFPYAPQVFSPYPSALPYPMPYGSGQSIMFGSGPSTNNGSSGGIGSSSSSGLTDSTAALDCTDFDV